MPDIVKIELEDLPKGWSVEEEPPERQKENRQGKEIDSRILWLIFAGVFVAIIAVSLMPRQAQESQTTSYVNGIKISGEGSPIHAIRALTGRSDLVGAFLNPEKDEHSRNALLELGEILKSTTSLRTQGNGYEIRVGLSERTGIFVHKKYLTIEGEDVASLWKAVWVFASIISGADIDSSVDLWHVQDLVKNTENVSVVVDTASCPYWAKISSALGNVNGALGFRQAETNFTLSQYVKERNGCELQFTSPDLNITNVTACPARGVGSFVISFNSAGQNRLTIRQDGVDVAYKDCDSMIDMSLILRDMLAPQFLSGVEKAPMPVDY